MVESSSKKFWDILGKVTWIAMLGLVGGFAIVLEWDREAQKNPVLAHKIPRIAGSYALGLLAQEAYNKGDIRTGLVYSRQLVLRRPVPAEPMALFAFGLIQTGQPQQGSDALILSAKRGWRESYTQVTFARWALETDQPDVAAARIIALWRTDTMVAETKQLTLKLLAMPGGLKALTDGLLPRDPWGTTLLNTALSNQLPLSQVEALSRALDEKNVVVSCSQLVVPLRMQARLGNAHRIERIWSELCVNAVAETSLDYAFNSANRQGPLDWNYPRHGGLALDLVNKQQGYKLKYEYMEFDRVVLAKRTINLLPGTHTIDIEGNIEGTPLGVAITCFKPNLKGETIFKGEASHGKIQFEIPVHCRGQDLTITTGHGVGSIERLTID